jgi:O-antigen/teichoic acid export membrane protein
MRIWRAAGTLLASSGATFVLRLLRNVLIARLISVENYGIASTFAVALSFLQMMTNFNFRKMLIQHRSGDSVDFSGTIVSLGIVQNVIMAAGLYVGAGAIARLFGQPDLVWAYQIVAIAPLIAMLQHPDLQRFQRSMRFGRFAGVALGTEAVTLAMAWPLALWLGDFRVMIGILVADRLLRTVLSHVLAERPFVLGWDWYIVREGLRFGWPLMLGGLAVFATQQGERIIVANRFSATDLGYFSAALTLVMPAVLLTGQLVQTFFTPLLARVQDHADLFRTRAGATLQATLCAGVGASLGFVLLGQPVLELTFGARYAPAGLLVGLVGILFALMIPREGATTVSLAKGHTVSLLASSVVRVLFLPLAVAAAIWTDSIVAVLLVGVAGQVAAYVSALVLLRYRSGVRGIARQMGLPLGLAALSLAAMLQGILGGPDPVIGPGPSNAVAFLAFAALVLSCRAMQRELLRGR